MSARWTRPAFARLRRASARQCSADDKIALMTSWEGAPQPVGKSRWRLPRPSEWPDSDLLAVGADLAPATVIDAYRRGMFPMGVGELGDRLGWWSPDPRGILPLDALRVTRSMRQSTKRFEIRVNTCFTRVMR